MLIKEGTKLRIHHNRFGVFYGIAIKDFNTEIEEFYPIELDQDMLCGLSTDWVRGDMIPCRNVLCKIEEVK